MNDDKQIVDLQKITFSIAKQEDSKGVHKALLKNLVDIEDISNVEAKKKKSMESNGFLRKEEPETYYAELIKDPNCEIFLAKESNGQIIGFASIHKNKFDVRNFRKTLSNLYIKNEDDLILLTDKNFSFNYLDQISIYPSYKRMGIGTKIMENVFKKCDKPVVSFVVKSPIYNKTSSLWHKKNSFKLAGTCDGQYKNVDFEWEVFISSN